MAATVQIVVFGRRWEPVSPERRALVLDVRFEIHDNGGAVHMMNQAIRYPPAKFNGMTPPQAQQMILTEGVGGMPGLEQLARDFLADWNASAVIRAIPFPITFTPTP